MTSRVSRGLYCLTLDWGIPGKTFNQIWNDDYNLPAYTAPEIANKSGNVGPATDVYGLGMLLYEMLAGKPAIEYHLQRDQNVIKNVLNGQLKPTGRIDLKNIPEITERAISRDYAQRFPDVMQFVRVLQPNLPRIPGERKSRQVELENILHYYWRTVGSFTNSHVGNVFHTR